MSALDWLTFGGALLAVAMFAFVWAVCCLLDLRELLRGQSQRETAFRMKGRAVLRG